jgi:hypothetical protein
MAEKRYLKDELDWERFWIDGIFSLPLAQRFSSLDQTHQIWGPIAVEWGNLRISSEEL